MENATRRTSRWALAMLLPACAGCVVGPDFHAPETSVPERWSELEPGLGTAGIGDAELARWWDAFQDPTLSALVARADAGNLDLAQAEARLRAARAALTIAGARRWPSVDASADATRASTEASSATLARAGFDALWELDLFGGARREAEAAGADLEAARFEREAVRVTLAAEVASTYLTLRGAQRELEIARANLGAQQQTVALTRRRFEVGLVSELDVQNAEAQVDTTQATIPSLEADAHAAMHALGVLLGEEPEALLAELTPGAPLPAAPPAVPLALPSELLRRRPDVRAAEARLHAATARVGVATAELFPKLTLSASVGLAGTNLGSLQEGVWSAGASLLQPLFAAGSLRAGVELQRAEVEERFAAYRASVLGALREVETALVQVTREQERRGALTQAVQAESRALDLATELYGAGRTDFLNVLGAQRLRFEAEDALAQSERQVDLGLIALYKALGGGWQVAPAAGAG